MQDQGQQRTLQSMILHMDLISSSQYDHRIRFARCLGTTSTSSRANTVTSVALRSFDIHYFPLFCEHGDHPLGYLTQDTSSLVPAFVLEVPRGPYIRFGEPGTGLEHSMEL